MKYVNCLWLFLKIVGRKWEDERVSISTAWRTAKLIWINKTK